MPQDVPADPDQFRMTFGDHLEDLRRRLIYAIVGLCVAACVTFYFGMDLIVWLQAPLAHALRRAGLPAQLYTRSVTSAFGVYMKVGVIAAIILALPWVLYQVWKFVSLGLYPAERKIVGLLAPFSAMLTAAGVLFGYYIMLPVSLIFFVGFSINTPPPVDQLSLMDGIAHWISPGFEPSATPAADGAATTQPMSLPVLSADAGEPTEGQMWIKVPENEVRVFIGGKVRLLPLASPTLMTPLVEPESYLGLVMFMGLGIVLAFQLPLVMLVAAWTGLVDPTLVGRYRKHALFGCVVAAALLTPTGDPFTLAALSIPLIVLFELGLLLMKMTWRRRRAAMGEDSPA